MGTRTRAFALSVIGRVPALEPSGETPVMGRPLPCSAPSLAANDRAACRARSRAASIARGDLVIEGLDEAGFRLDLLAEPGPAPRSAAAPPLDGAHTLFRLPGTARHTAPRTRS